MLMHFNFSIIKFEVTPLSLNFDIFDANSSLQVHDIYFNRSINIFVQVSLSFNLIIHIL